MPQLRQFELLQELKPFCSAKASLLKWNGTRYVLTPEEIVVFDFIGTYGDRRDRGYTHFIPESTRWESISVLTSAVENWMPY